MTRFIGLSLATIALTALGGCMEVDNALSSTQAAHSSITATAPSANPSMPKPKPSASSPDATIRMENRTF